MSYKDAVVLDSINEGEKISILSDSMLKTMFQNENRIKYSAKFISYFLDVSYEELLKNIHLSKNELDKKVDNDKGEKCDYVALIDNTSINIEVNNNGSIGVLERNMEYVHRLYSRLIKKSKVKNEYTQVIQFNLNNFSFEGIDDIVDMYLVQNDNHTTMSNKLIYIQIYIPNLIRKWYTMGIQKLTEAEKYLLTLVLKNIDTSKEIGGGIKIMEDYIDDAEIVSLDEDLRESYDKEWAMKDLGMQVGYEQGLEKGLEDGTRQGLERGIEQNTTETCIRMHDNNFDNDTISLCLNITKDEVEKIIKNNE